MSESIKEFLKEKRASAVTKAPGFWAKHGDKVKGVGAFTGLAVAADMVGDGAQAAIRNLSEPVVRSYNFKKMKSSNPWLSQHSSSDVKKFYTTLHKFAPSVASDPLAAGSWMKKSLAFKSEGVGTPDIDQLTGIQKKIKDVRGDNVLRKALGKGGLIGGVSDMSGIAKNYTPKPPGSN